MSLTFLRKSVHNIYILCARSSENMLYQTILEPRGMIILFCRPQFDFNNPGDIMQCIPCSMNITEHFMCRFYMRKGDRFIEMACHTMFYEYS